MVQVHLLIGDHDRPATGAATFSRRNPVSGEEASIAAAATVADAVAAADAAADAFPLWSSLGPNERRTRLLRAADLLQARSTEFVSLMTAENGATRRVGPVQRASRRADAARGRIPHHPDHRSRDPFRCTRESCAGPTAAGRSCGWLRSMECTRDFGGALDRRSSGLRQYCYFQSLGNVPRDPSTHWLGPARGWTRGRCRECPDACAGRRAGCR